MNEEVAPTSPGTEFTAPDPCDLTTVGEVQSFMAPDGAGTDTATVSLLQLEVTGASRFIASYCGREFWADPAVTEVRNGTDQAVMWLRKRPVWGLTSVSVYSTPLIVVTDQFSSGVTYDDRAIYGRGWFSGTITGWVGGNVRFIRGVKNIKIVYSGGYQTPGQVALAVTGIANAPYLPADLQLACDTLVSYWYKRRRNLANVSVGEGPEKITFYTKDMPDQVRLTLNLYKSAFYLGTD